MKASILIILCFLFCSPTYAAEESPFGLHVGGMIGYSVGTLNRKDSEVIKGMSAQGFLGLDLYQFNLHGFFQNTSLGYTSHREVYNGTYSLYGAGIAYTAFQGKSSRMIFELQIPTSGSYTVLAESTSTINAQDYKQSTLTTLTGGSAYQAQVGYEFVPNGRRAVSDSFFFGFYASYLMQTFTTQTTWIQTDNSEVAPPSPGKEDVGYSVGLFSAFAVVRYGF